MASQFTVVLGLLVLGFAAVLLYHHWRDWSELRARQFPADESGQQEGRYRRRRLRRRLQTTLMVGIVGACMIAAVILRRLGASPVWIVGIWSAILILLVWILLLAVADITETQRHFGRMRRNVILEQTLFLARLRRTSRSSPGSSVSQREGDSGNGKPAPSR